MFSATSCSQSAISLPSLLRLLLRAGKPTRSAMKPGSKLYNILKFVVSSLVRFSSVYSVIGMSICLENITGYVLTIMAGSVDDGDLFRMLLSCSSVFSC